MKFFKTKYRIIGEQRPRNSAPESKIWFQPQIKYWWFPFWFNLIASGSFVLSFAEEDVEHAIARKKFEVVKEYE